MRNGLRKWTFGVLLFSFLAIEGCSLKRQIECGHANGNRAQCEEMSNDCQVNDESRCDGSAVCGTFCQLDHERHACAVRDQSTSPCPRDSRLFSAGAVQAIEQYKWAYDKLTSTGKTLSGKTLTKNDVETLTTEDKRIICGAFIGDVCDLHWNTKGYAECTVGAIDCSVCVSSEKPIKCLAKNKCNGVICL